MPPPLPSSLIDKVWGVVAETHDVEDVAPGLFGLELTADEQEYVTELGRKVLLALLETRKP
jgi:hypothetical protein